jgi:PAS domain S-box-containing protein
MFVLDLDGRITWVNARARRPRFGEDPSSLMGSFWRDLWTETQRDAAVERFETASGDSVERFSGALTVDLGGAWLDVVLAPIHDAEGRVARLLAMGRDITEQRRVAEERDRLTNRLEETLRLNETFVAAVGHDLRNPLSAVQHGLESVPILMEVSGEPAAVVIEVRNGGAIPSHAMSDLSSILSGGDTAGLAPMGSASVSSSCSRSRWHTAGASTPNLPMAEARSFDSASRAVLRSPLRRNSSDS